MTDAVVLKLGLDTTEFKTGKSDVDAVAASAKRAELAADGLISGWKRTSDTLGKTRAEVIAYDASQLRLTQSQKASVDAIAATIAAYDKQAAAQAAAAGAARAEAQAQAQLAAEQVRRAAATQAQVDAWVRQAAVLGKSKTAVMEMQAAELNLTTAQKAQVAASIKSTEAFEAQAIAAEKTKTRVTELSTHMAAFIGIVGIGALAHQFIELSDSIATLSARMKSATDTEEEAHEALKMLRDLASETQMKFEPLAHGFIELGESIKNMGGKADTTTKVMQALTFAARAQGQSAEDAAGMAATFARALTLGVQGGREFVSLLKQNDDVARALARGLGYTTQELKRLAQEGLVDPQRLVAALISQMKELEEEAKKMPKTVGGSLNEIWNEVQRAASGGNANALADFLHAIAVGVRLASDDTKGFARELVDVVLSAVTGGLSDNARQWDAWASKVEGASARGRTAIGKIRGDANFASPDALFTGDKAFQAALGQLTQQINQSNTAEGINARANQARTVIENIWNNMVKADAEGAKKYASQAKELFAGIEKDRKLALQALAKQGTVSLSVLFGNLDKQVQLEASAFADLNKVEQAGYKQQLDILESAHTLGLTSEREYIDRRGAIAKAGAESELKQIRDTYAATAAELAAVEAARPRDQDEQILKKTKIAELTKTLRDLAVAWGLAEQKQGDIARQTEQAQIERQERLRQSLLQIRNAVQDYETGLKEQNEQLSFETSLLDKSEKEQHQLTAAHQADLDLKKQLLPIQRELTELEVIGQGDSALAAAKRAQIEAITQANREQLDIAKQRIGVYDDEAKRIDNLKSAWSGVQDFVTGFINALKGGWKNAMDYLKDQFKQLLLKLLTELALQKFVLPIFLQVVGGGSGIAGFAQQGSSLLNGLSSMFGGGSGGGGGLGNLFSPGSSPGGTAGFFGNLFGGSGAGGMGEGGIGTGMFGGAGFGMGDRSLGTVGMFEGGGSGMFGLGSSGFSLSGSMMGAGIGAGIGMLASSLFGNERNSSSIQTGATIGGSIGMIWGPIGSVIGSALGAAIGSLFKSGGGPKSGGYGAKDVDLATGKTSDFEHERFFTPSDSDDKVVKIAETVANDYFKIAQSLGIKSGNASFAFGFDTDPKGTAPDRVSAGAFIDGKQVYDVHDVNVGKGDQAALEERLALEAKRATLAALQASDLPEYLSKIFNEVDVSTANADDIQKVIEEAQALKQAVDVMAGLGDQFNKLDPDQIRSLMDAFGGLENFGKAFQFLGDNFLTNEQKFNNANEQLNKAFGDLGLEVPKTHQAFLDLLSGMDLSTEAGRTLYASVVALAPAFVAVAGTAEQAAEALRQQVHAAEDVFNQNFFTQQERDATAATAAWDQVHAAWGANAIALHALGYDHIPTTTAGFRQMIQSIDRSTAAGEALYQSMILLAPSVVAINTDVANLADTADTAGDTISSAADQINLHISDLQSAAQQAQTTLSNVISSIDEIANSNPGDFGDKLGTKIQLLAEQGSRYQTLLAEQLNGPDPYGALAVAYRNMLQQLSGLQSTATDQLARFTVLKAQYGGAIAEQLVQLQDWYKSQQALFSGNTVALAALKVEYDQKWKAIIEGTGDAVDKVADQMAKLRQAILDYVNGLKVSDLSPLTPAQKLAEAQRQYQDRLTQARSGNVDALGDITKYSDEYLKQLRDFYASAPAYTQAFNRVLDELTALGTPPGSGAAPGSAHGDTFDALTSALPDGSKMMSQQDAKDMAGAIIEAIQNLGTNPDPAVKQAVEKLARKMESTTRK